MLSPIILLIVVKQEICISTNKITIIVFFRNYTPADIAYSIYLTNKCECDYKIMHIKEFIWCISKKSIMLNLWSRYGKCILYLKEKRKYLIVLYLNVLYKKCELYYITGTANPLLSNCCFSVTNIVYYIMFTILLFILNCQIEIKARFFKQKCTTNVS